MQNYCGYPANGHKYTRLLLFQGETNGWPSFRDLITNNIAAWFCAIELHDYMNRDMITRERI